MSLCCSRMTIFERAARPAIVVVLLSLMVTLLPGPRGHAAQSEGTVGLQILRQPAWHSPDDDFNLKVEITNDTTEPLLGYGLVVGLYPRALNRTGLHSNFDLSESEPFGSFPIQYEDTVEPGGSVVKTIRQPVADSPVLTAASPNGVYPLKLSVVDSFGATLDSVSTQLMYYPMPPDPPELAMNTILVLPIGDIPRRSPAGVFTPDDLGDYPLEDAIAEGGWLSGMLEVLREELGNSTPREPARNGRLRITPNLRMSVVPSARLVEELDDMADGYLKEVDGEVTRVPADDPAAEAAADLLETMKDVLSSPAIQPITAPYSFADLPSLAPYPLATGDQLTEADKIYQSVFDVDFAPDWVYSPGGRLDAASLSELWLDQSAGHTFLEPNSLVPPENLDLAGCPTAALSAACPIEVETVNDSLTGYALDRDVQDRVVEMTRSSGTRVDMQRLFAEMSMIREEEPSLGERIIPIVIPSNWMPAPGTFRTFIRGLDRAPWLEMMTPEEGLEAAEDPAPRQIVSTATPHPRQPEADYFDEVLAAERTVDSFATMGPPAGLVTRLRRNLLTAFSRAWWGDREAVGHEYVDASEREIQGELDHISLLAADTTLSSRNGSIQFVVSNDTGYEIDISVALRGNIEVDDEQLELNIPEEQQSVTIKVTALTSGIFGLDVQLKTPDGRLDITESRTITIRSTEYNRIALGLTFGALAFLVLFYLIRGMRRRRAGAEDDTGDEVSTA